MNDEKTNTRLARDYSSRKCASLLLADDDDDGGEESEGERRIQSPFRPVGTTSESTHTNRTERQERAQIAKWMARDHKISGPSMNRTEEMRHQWCWRNNKLMVWYDRKTPECELFYTDYFLLARLDSWERKGSSMIHSPFFNAKENMILTYVLTNRYLFLCKLEAFSIDIRLVATIADRCMT